MMNVPLPARNAQDAGSDTPRTPLATRESEAPMLAASPLENAKASAARTTSAGAGSEAKERIGERRGVGWVIRWVTRPWFRGQYGRVAAGCEAAG